MSYLGCGEGGGGLRHPFKSPETDADGFFIACKMNLCASLLNSKFNSVRSRMRGEVAVTKLITFILMRTGLRHIQRHANRHAVKNPAVYMCGHRNVEVAGVPPRPLLTSAVDICCHVCRISAVLPRTPRPDTTHTLCIQCTVGLDGISQQPLNSNGLESPWSPHNYGPFHYNDEVIKSDEPDKD